MFVQQTILDNTKNVFLHSCLLAIIRDLVWCFSPIIQHNECTSAPWTSPRLLVQTGTPSVPSTDTKNDGSLAAAITKSNKVFCLWLRSFMTSASIHEPVVSCPSACKHSKISDSSQFLSLTIFTFVLVLLRTLIFQHLCQLKR